jgi:hypothetical protein
MSVSSITAENIARHADPQYHFTAPPGRTVRQLQRAGFVLEAIRG